MLSLKLQSLSLFLLQALGAFAQLEEEEVEAPSTTPNLAVSVSASFPHAEIFGVKLVNGHPTQVVLSFSNDEPGPVTVAFLGGSLWTLDEPSKVVRNLTTTRYNVAIPAGEKESLSYAFATDLMPRDLRLNLAAVLVDAENTYYTLPAFNGTVTVVEPETSFFDPQLIFLYLILASAFAGTSYFIYSTWLSSLFPQKKRGGKGGERAKASSRGSKKVDPSDQVAVTGADGPAVTSGAKAYDESWIPEHHIKRPEAKRVRSGAPATKKRTVKAE